MPLQRMKIENNQECESISFSIFDPLMNNIALITGYLASSLLAISLLVNNDIKFRWFNIFACISFIIYGLIIKAFPVTLTNTILLVINIVRLVQLYTKKEYFQIVQVAADGPVLTNFVSYYKTDIENYFPGFSLQECKECLHFLVFRNMDIANAFIAKVEDGNALVKLNYTVKKYRDYKIGKFIFDTDKTYLLSKGIKSLTYDHVHNTNHKLFLKRMGFEMSDSGKYVKDL
jgi:hypothetical protein